MTLRAKFTLQRGALHLDVDLTVQDGETVALVGPNGAGKTTCLRALAGLLAVQHGTIALGDDVLDGGPGGAFVAPEDRGVGFVFQEHLLFPHLSALDNVAFGLRAGGMPRPAARAAAVTWLQRVGLGDHGASLPSALSGGQSQRVALARALATSPRLLLLDEPLAAVDATARLELRRDLRGHLQTFRGVRLLVAHAAVDAFALADRIAVIEAGRVVQLGTVAEICSRPRSRYVADLVGLNCFRGTAADGVVAIAGGGQLVTASALDGAVFATVHPRAVSLFRERPAGSPRNVFAAPITAIEPAIDCVRVQVGGPLALVAEVTTAAVGDLRLATGGEVWVALKATEIAVHPA
jgi:molybdate transport system ATP-binding protein